MRRDVTMTQSKHKQVIFEKCYTAFMTFGSHTCDLDKKNSLPLLAFKTENLVRVWTTFILFTSVFPVLKTESRSKGFSMFVERLN